jgi:penicillin amidase
LVYPDPRSAGRSIDISGAGLPGMPAVVIGSNGKVAWSFTNGYIDTADWVRVTRDPADPGRYRNADGWASISKQTEILHVHGAPDATLDVEETQWGPIVAKDADGTPLALAWTPQQPGALDIGLGRMEEAGTVAEAVAIAQASGIPPQNLVVGDDAGNIAWTIAGRIPKRIGGFEPALPGDWSQAGTGWDGWLAAGDVPLVSNPADDRLWTANQRVVGDAALVTLGDAGYDLGARATDPRRPAHTREFHACRHARHPARRPRAHARALEGPDAA